DEGKVKFPRAKIAYSGSAPGAFGFIQRHTVAAIQKLAAGNTATGYGGHAAATGDRGHAAATGYGGHAAATGDRGHAAATGNGGHAPATGDRGHATATGDGGHATATGENSIAASLGIYRSAQGALDTWIVLAAHDDNYTLV